MRVFLIPVFVLATAACAAHAAPATSGPLPFPRVGAPVALRPAVAPVPMAPVTRAEVLETALGYRGVPYRFGGEDPSTGFDCSGFIRYVLGAHALQVPRTTGEQYRLGRTVTRRDIEPGDLVFFSTVAPGASHVGLAVSRDEFVHAPATSGVVRVERLDADYWRSRFVGARRVLTE